MHYYYTLKQRRYDLPTKSSECGFPIITVGNPTTVRKLEIQQPFAKKGQHTTETGGTKTNMKRNLICGLYSRSSYSQNLAASEIIVVVNTDRTVVGRELLVHLQLTDNRLNPETRPIN